MQIKKIDNKQLKIQDLQTGDWFYLSDNKEKSLYIVLNNEGCSSRCCYSLENNVVVYFDMRYNVVVVTDIKIEVVV